MWFSRLGHLPSRHHRRFQAAGTERPQIPHWLDNELSCAPPMKAEKAEKSADRAETSEGGLRSPEPRPKTCNGPMRRWCENVLNT